MSSLSLPVVKLTEQPQRFPLVADAAWWEENRGHFRDPDSTPVEPFGLDLEGYRLGNRLLFRGELAGVLELPCGRCAELYPHPIREHIELLLEPLPTSANASAPDAGIELDPEDLEIGRYAGDELDFGVVLREILLFEWPMQPRCAESCLGLCPSCGGNRNQGSCNCQGEAEEAASPFAALGELLGKATEQD